MLFFLGICNSIDYIHIRLGCFTFCQFVLYENSFWNFEWYGVVTGCIGMSIVWQRCGEKLLEGTHHKDFLTNSKHFCGTTIKPTKHCSQANHKKIVAEDKAVRAAVNFSALTTKFHVHSFLPFLELEQLSVIEPSLGHIPWHLWKFHRLALGESNMASYSYFINLPWKDLSQDKTVFDPQLSYKNKKAPIKIGGVDQHFRQN